MMCRENAKLLLSGPVVEDASPLSADLSRPVGEQRPMFAGVCQDLSPRGVENDPRFLSRPVVHEERKAPFYLFSAEKLLDRSRVVSGMIPVLKWRDSSSMELQNHPLRQLWATPGEGEVCWRP